MSDHHDWDHHDDGHEAEHHVEEVLPIDELQAPETDDVHDWDEPAPPLDDPLPYEHHEPAAVMDDEIDTAGQVNNEVIGADPDAVPDEPVTAEVFPPMVDVGDLPEPVDGFPWIDTGSLGVVPPLDTDVAAAPDPAELAAYAAEDLPPGQDPWAVLKDSEDPATSALARFYAEPPDPAGRTSPDS